MHGLSQRLLHGVSSMTSAVLNRSLCTSSLFASTSSFLGPSCFTQQIRLAGRWWPQEPRHQIRSFSTGTDIENGADVAGPSCDPPPAAAVAKSVAKFLDRAAAAPVYAPTKVATKSPFQLVKGPDGQLQANFKLWRASVDKAAISSLIYRQMSSEERDVHMAHMMAVQKRQLTYKDPKSGFDVFTISQLLVNGDCCGNGCRHCPFELKNASERVRREKIWNGSYYL